MLKWFILNVGLAAMAYSQTESGARQQLPADFDWKFLLGDPSGAEAVAFNDASWRSVNLPHDWSIEGKPDAKNPSGSGGGYFPGGIGWYRKTFTAPASWKGKRVSAEFDGVYMDATVYLNGRKLGNHPNGYLGFVFDLTPDLTLASKNVLAVRVDNSAQPNSRWYSGSGIYRHVRISITEPVHIAHWGVFVTTPEVAADKAQIGVRTLVSNDSSESSEVTIRTAVIGPRGGAAGQSEARATVAGETETVVNQEIAVANPSLWSPQTPELYRAIVSVVRGGKVIDQVVTPFGVRSVAWSVEQGFVLNGKSTKLAGGSVHHDNGPLGAAAFDRAEERRVELLKAAGFNAVRTAHNPPSTAFLNACDRLGLLVLDEPFDTWTLHKAKFDYARFFNDWWQRDIDAMVLRDRNHPSVVIWGIGNEIPEAWTKDGAPIAHKLAKEVRKLDPTRPLTEAFPGATYGPNPDAVFALVDIGGYNYNLAANSPEDHRRAPSRLMMTTESFPADAFEQWQLVHDNSYIAGEFVWTAMDYLGESGIGSSAYLPPEDAAQAEQANQFLRSMVSKMGANGENPFAAMATGDAPGGGGMPPVMRVLFPGYPWHAADCGDLDLTGFRKPRSFYRDILWNGGDRVFATVRVPEPEGKKTVAIGWSVFPTIASWTWPGREGQDMQVEVYSSAPWVRLYLNDKAVGEQPTQREQQFKATFSVPYQAGVLKAVGLNGGQTVAESILATAGEPAQLRLTPDRALVHADGQDLSFITVEALDAKGEVQPNAGQMVDFELSGPGMIAAVGNGDGASDMRYQGNQARLFHGRALLVVRTAKTAGTIRITATASRIGQIHGEHSSAGDDASARVITVAKLDLAPKFARHLSARSSKPGVRPFGGLDTSTGKTISYLYEDNHLLQGPNRSAGRVPADGPCRAWAGVRRRASRPWGLSLRPAFAPAERRRHRLAARLSTEGLLRAHRIRVHGFAVRYLVDANVLSEPTKPTPDSRVVAWLRAHEPDIAIDPIILGELRFGILILPKGRKRAALERWFEAGVGRLHCLPWDADTGLKWAELLARLRTTGKAMPIKDSLIAATAAVHGLAVATRNGADFVNAGVRIVDPFAGRDLT